MMRFDRIRGLLIDIDDTITRAKAGCEECSLFDVLQSAAVDLAGLAPDDAAARIEKIRREITWWHWSDYIVALGLPPRAFWDYAYAQESRYLEPVDPQIEAALRRLHDRGTLLFITSNNPCSGSLNKLRIAGLGDFHRCDLFSRFLGPPELHAMKSEPLFWQKAMAHIGLDGPELAVVGDDPVSDYAIPHSVGIAGTFLMCRDDGLPRFDRKTLTHVQDFGTIADALLGASARPPQATRRGKCPDAA